MKKIIFSGMQATGSLCIGHYIGAAKNWIQLQDEYQCLYCVVDLHSLTIRQDPERLRQKARELLMMYIALGLDPEKNILYFQSQVPAHTELAWILNCYTYIGELSRMTQFKEKSQKHADNINAGLYTYPVLMAADILLYQANLVPVGDDQKQHLEICRDIAIRFNNIYGNIFTIPEPYIPKMGARIMSLQEPDKKMSKSETENMNNVIFLLDSPDVIIQKFKRAVTDSDGQIRFDPAAKPGVSNLLTIYACMAGKSIEESEKEFIDQGYGVLKKAVGEIVNHTLAPVRQKFNELSADKAYIDDAIKRNGQKAAEMAYVTLEKVKQAIGLQSFL